MTKQSFKKSLRGKALGQKGSEKNGGCCLLRGEVGNNDAIVAAVLVKVREDKLCFAQLQNTQSWGFLGKQRVGPRDVVARECSILV